MFSGLFPREEDALLNWEQSALETSLARYWMSGE